MMISENVHVLWDEIPSETDFIDALACLNDENNRNWLFNEFLESQLGISEKFLKEYVESLGTDELFFEILQEADLMLSQDFLMNILDIGVEDSDLPMILGHYYGNFSGEGIIKLFDSYDVPNEYAKVFLSERIEGDLSFDQIYTILDLVDKKLYSLLNPYIKKLPFEKRMELVNVFDIAL
jgi:hypothetical protein